MGLATFKEGCFGGTQVIKGWWPGNGEWRRESEKQALERKASEKWRCLQETLPGVRLKNAKGRSLDSKY